MKFAEAKPQSGLSSSIPAESQATGRFSFAVPQDQRRTLARAWLWLALASLIGAGILSILLVMSRTPYLQNILPLADFFHVALVVHVDLSVLVWFLAFAGLLWSINGNQRFMALAWSGWAACAAGAVIITLAPFFGRGGPIMSNYVPMLEDPLFIAGLSIFGIGFALLVLRSLMAAPKVGMTPNGNAALAFGLNTAAVAAAVALFALVWSFLTVPGTLEGKAYYELLYWGGGHVIQFTYTLLMLVCWLWLADACGARPPLSPRVALLLFGIGLGSVFLVPPIYLAYNVASVEHRQLLTWLMRFGGGLPILPTGLAVMIGLYHAGNPRRMAAEVKPLYGALVSSLGLFAVGGVIGFLISGNNVKIPAHYHGCIVGVTLAMMGLAYHLLPSLGYARPNSRMAAWQPTVYGLGQVMHIVGLVWSGGYGVQRKVAGSAQVLRTTGEVAGMGLMGFGGLVAVVGGIMFLLVMLKAMKAGKDTMVTADVR